MLTFTTKSPSPSIKVPKIVVLFVDNFVLMAFYINDNIRGIVVVNDHNAHSLSKIYLL